MSEAYASAASLTLSAGFQSKFKYCWAYLCFFVSLRTLWVCAVYGFTCARGEIKKVQKRRKSSRRRTSVRQRRFSAVEKAKTLFRLLKESARIPTSFRKSDYTKAVIKCLVFAFLVCAFLAPTEWGRDKIVWSVRFRRTRRTIVRRAAKSGAEKAKTLNFMQESVRIPTP